MKKLVMAIFITTAFSLAYGMEKEQKTTTSKNSQATSQLNRKNLITSFLGLGTGVCAYLTYLALTSDNEWYKGIRTETTISKYTASGYQHITDELKDYINFTIPKVIFAIFPALATCAFGKSFLNKLSKSKSEAKKA